MIPESAAAEIENSVGSADWTLSIDELERFSQVVEVVDDALLLVRRRATSQL